MRRTLRLLRLLLVILVVVLVVAAGGGYLFLRRSLPQTSGTVRVPGLGAPVEIRRDADAIPHIYAQSREDAFYGLGYVHAQERLWQLEFQRRIGQGRLSEILGDATVGTDRFLRTLGVYRAAEQAWATLPQRSKAAVSAYAAGINAYLDGPGGSRLPPEFLIVGAPKPAHWTGPDVLVWVKMMAYDLGDNWNHELLRSDIVRAVGAERAAELLPPYPDGAPSIVAAAPSTERYSELLALDDGVRALLGIGGVGGEDLGSNNWVVDGTKSASGKPLLADDPHLATRIPSIWFLAHLSAPGYEVIGATIPGLPGFPVGHNRTIAWGVTNVGPDVQDLFRERLDATGTRYEADGQLRPLEIISDTLKVKGAEDIPLTIRITRHGPLISDALNATDEPDDPDRQPAREALALRWTALDPDDTTTEAFIGINEAQNWDEFQAALRGYVAPAQNFVYADTAGNIGYYAPGRIPIRAAGDGSQPAEGWSGANEWTGAVPFEALPHAFNPPEHFVVTANNKPVPPDYPYFLGRDFALPYRYQRIRELIEAKDQLTPEDFAAIQADTVSLHARELVPLLLPLVRGETDTEQRALELLRSWDGDTRGDSAAAMIFEAWYQRLPRAIAGDEIGNALVTRYEAQFGFARQFVQAALTDAGAWCDDAGTMVRESCATIATATFAEVVEELAETQGADPARWRWDRAHTVVFPHQPLDSVAALRPLLSRRLPHGGDNSTVNVGPFSFTAPFEQRAVPGYRHIIDLANLDEGRFIQSVGQSGNPLSPHYADYMADWQAVRYRRMRFERGTVEAETESTLRLEPAAP